MSQDLTPKHMRCPAGDCPSITRLDDGRLLIVGAEAPTDLDETVFGTEIKIGNNEAGVLISPSLLDTLMEEVRREERERCAKIADAIGCEVDQSWLDCGMKIASAIRTRKDKDKVHELPIK